MSSKQTAEQDPFTDSPMAGDKGSALQPENVRDRLMAQETQELRLLSSNSSTRIPRGVPQKPSQGAQSASLRGVRAAPDIRSSIPLPITLRRHSVEAMGSPRVTPSGSFAGGIRVVDKPNGPRPKPSSDEQLAVPDQESATNEEKGKDRKSCSSSSISDWDFGDDDAAQRPQNVFTGEYRTPEKLIMGPDSPGSTFAVTQRSNPALVHYPDTPTRFSGKRRVDTGSSSSPIHGPSSSNKKDSNSAESTPLARNYCRSAISLESIPRKDFGRDRAIQRKPVNSPSLSSLYSPSGQDEHEPLVPRVPEKYSTHLKGSKSASPVTPVKSTSQSGECSVPKNYPTPNTAGSPESLRTFPPRTSSRDQASQRTMQSGPGPAIVSAHVSDQAEKQSSNVAPQNLSKEPTTQAEQLARLPDSKSTRMLDSFRNIFKHKNTVDKSRGKKEERETPEPEARAQTPVTAIRLRNEDNRTGPAKGVFMSRARYTSLSDGVSWNKTPRSPKSSDEQHPSARQPISISPPAAPVVQHVEDTPSFARPTKSTRTKAGPVRGHSVGGSDVRVRKGHIMIAPTGSPQRPSRYRTPHAGLSSGHKNIINLPRSIGSVRSNPSSTPGKSLATANDTSDITKTLDEIHACIETLCKRATDENARSKREGYLRMALSLQYQYSNYNNIRKEVTEAEELANKKRSEKCLAENALFEHFSQVKAHLHEE
ncbi:hypothetical protein HFD88_000580 [Aspergillus terreus]|nr:hypothetical protein HFD88_000580 [Aspergillus terreus]